MNTILFNMFIEMVSKNYFVRLIIGSTDSSYKQDLIALASIVDQNITTTIIHNGSKLHNKNLSFTLLPGKRNVTFKIMGDDLLMNNPELSRILIYNTRGALIDRVALENGKTSSEVVGTWDGNNLKGVKVSSGSYFAVVDLKDGYFSRKFILP